MKNILLQPHQAHLWSENGGHLIFFLFLSFFFFFLYQKIAGSYTLKIKVTQSELILTHFFSRYVYPLILN